MRILRSLLEHPSTRGLDLDDPATTALRREIIRSKPILRNVYEEWYGTLAAQIPPGAGGVVEIGAGGGFLDDFVPAALRTEVFLVPGVRAVCDAQMLPFSTGSLKAVVMTNVFHHVRSPRAFLAEAARALRPGGVVAMLEPWVSPLSRVVYRSLHHEPFVPDAAAWELPAGGPLSSSNQALPWIVFQRDRAAFEDEFPGFVVRSVVPTAPARYVVSGGVGTGDLVPGWTLPLWNAFDRLLSASRERTALFAFVTLERVDRRPAASPPRTAALRPLP
jgi:SAM-dependent methyltransferase